jgi:hypothetical protein
MESHYDDLNKKLDKLYDKQRGQTKIQYDNQEQQFYPRAVNLTKIKFTKEELALLNQGLQHSIQKQFIEIYMSRKRCILLVVVWRYTCDARTYERQIC